MSTAGREFTITLEGTEYRIEVQGNTVLVNGQPFVVGFEEGGVIVDGTPYEVTLEGDQAIINGIAYSFGVAGLEVLGPAAPAPAPPREIVEGAGVIKAIMPGKVIEVLVGEGDEVQEGDVVLVLEAMKMENELRADRGGVVKQVAVAKGDDVELGQVLVVIE